MFLPLNRWVLTVGQTAGDDASGHQSSTNKPSHSAIPDNIHREEANVSLRIWPDNVSKPCRTRAFLDKLPHSPSINRYQFPAAHIDFLIPQRGERTEVYETTYVMRCYRERPHIARIRDRLNRGACRWNTAAAARASAETNTDAELTGLSTA